jgi:hypothetical protein
MSKTQARWINYDTSLTAVGNSLSVRLSSNSLLQKTAEGVQLDSAKVILPTGETAFTANQSLSGFKITDVGTPTDNNDGVNKVYVDTLLATSCKKEALVVANNKVNTSHPPLSGADGIVNYSTVRYRNGSNVAYSEVEIDTSDATGKTFTLVDIVSGSWDGFSVTIQYIYRPTA